MANQDDQQTTPVRIALADLPQSALDLIGLIELPAALRLIEAMPGINFPVPRGENNNADGAAKFAMLVDAVGDEAARVLVRHYGGGDMYVPSCLKAIKAARNRQIVAEYESGIKVIALAIKYRLSYRQIEAILKATDTTAIEPSKQADLFA